MLYLEHSAEDLARGGPWKMGVLQHGRSCWRILRDEETVVYGGSGRRKLYGCVITLYDGQKDAPDGVARSNGNRNNKEGSEQTLLSLSQVRHVCVPMSACWLNPSLVRILSYSFSVAKLGTS